MGEQALDAYNREVTSSNGKSPPAPPTRVGHIGYLNSLPFLLGLEAHFVPLPFDLVVGPPSELNRRLLDGSLDVSPISSIRYAAHRDELVLLPDLCIASDGPVSSVLLVTKQPPATLDDCVVELDPSSATSHALVKLVLWQRFGVRPRFQVRRQSSLDGVRANAALVIGDQALRTQLDSDGWQLYDLGAEWKALSGCYMVYAVWAARREFAKQEPDRFDTVRRTLLEALRRGLSDREALIARAASLSGYPADFLRAYYSRLRYTLGDAERAGLREFYRRAGEYDLVPSTPAQA